MGDPPRLHQVVHPPGLGHQGLVARQRQDRGLDRGDLLVQRQQRPLLGPPGARRRLLHPVRVEEQDQQDPVHADGRFDHERQVPPFVFLVEVHEVLAAGLLVAAEVVVRAVGDPLQLAPPERELVLDVAGGLGVVRQLVGLVRADPELLLGHAELVVPVEPFADPVLEPPVVGPRLDEELHLHLLELPGPEDEVAGRDLVAERLPDLGHPEGHLQT